MKTFEKSVISIALVMTISAEVVLINNYYDEARTDASSSPATLEINTDKEITDVSIPNNPYFHHPVKL